MDLSHVKSYEQLQNYLKSFINWRGDVGPYDFGAVANLLGALLDNIREHAQDIEVEYRRAAYCGAGIYIAPNRSSVPAMSSSKTNTICANPTRQLTPGRRGWSCWNSLTRRSCPRCYA